MAVFTFLAVAAVAWAWTIRESAQGQDMAMSPESFGISWTVMMAAMMLPSAMPLVAEFVRTYERRIGWRSATAALCVTYLLIWLTFGLGAYALQGALPMSWYEDRMAGGAALMLAAIYALTPIKRASEARCRELCALHGPLPFKLTRSAVVIGARYGLSCVGCSAGLMLAMVVMGMSSLAWVVILSAMVLVYKLGPPLRFSQTSFLAAALGALGAGYVLTA
jgi:predicted metal-binding membrane protein